MLLAGAIFGFAGWLIRLPNVVEGVEREIPLRFAAEAIVPITGVGRVRAWRLSADDSRFGGVSGAAFEGGRLLAITDNATLLRLDLPTVPNPRVTLKPLPAVPGPAHRKVGRDSEALARDPLGRGWWVAFEQHHSLLLYDPGFTRLIERKPLRSAAFRPNRGVEALYENGDGRLVALPEASGISDAVRLADGRVALLRRSVGLGGIRSGLSIEGMDFALPVAAFDNPEAIAAAPLADGGTRLWILTDNDFRARIATLLVAIDLPPAVGPTKR